MNIHTRSSTTLLPHLHSARILFDQEPLTISNGYILDQGIITDSFGVKRRNYLIVLTGPGLNYNFTTHDFEGQGNLIVLGLFPATTLGLTAGIYSIHSNNLIGSSFLVMISNYNSKALEGMTNYTAKSGTVRIKKSVEKYTITFDLGLEGEGSDEFVHMVTGSFQGIIRTIEC